MYDFLFGAVHGLIGKRGEVTIDNLVFRLHYRASFIVLIAASILDTNDADVICSAAKKILLNLLDTSEEQPLKLRLMGVRMSELRDKNEAGASKQKTLKNFLSSKSKKASESVGANEYDCPVCGKAIKVDGIKEFNEHLDNCLNGIDSSNGGELKNVDKSLNNDEVGMNSKDINHDTDSFKTETISCDEDMEDMFSEHFCGDKVESDIEEEEMFANHHKEDIHMNETVNNNKEQPWPCLPCSQPEKLKSNSSYSQLSSISTQRPHLAAVAQSQQRSLSTSSFFRQKMDQERACSPVAQSDVVVLPEPEEVETFADNVKAVDDETKLTCPVCRSGQVFASELSLTRHVESCLSKQAINSMLRRENASAKTDVGTKVKLKRQIKDSRSCGEHATKKSASKPIDSYFKRH